jgi:hypothetical protein
VFEDTKGIIRIRKSKERQHNGQQKNEKERQHNGQKKKDKERQHSGQRKKDKKRQHNGQKKNDKERQHNGQKKKDKGTNNDLSNIIFTYLSKPFIFTFAFLFDILLLCYNSYIVGVNFIGGGNTSTKRKTPTCHKIVEVEYGTIVI